MAVAINVTLVWLKKRKMKNPPNAHAIISLRET
jgi:hypothetical protein